MTDERLIAFFFFITLRAFVNETNSPVSGLAAVTRLCPCGGVRGRVQNEWESMGFHPQKSTFLRM